MGLFGVIHGWEWGWGGRRVQKGPPSLKSITHILQSWNLVHLYLSWRRSLHQHFFMGNQQILLYQEIPIQIAFWFIIYILLTFFGSLKIFLVNMVTILMMSAKIATLGLLKLKIFWNKGYDVIVSLYDVINKLLSCDSNDI